MQVQDNLEHVLSASRNRRQYRRQPAAAVAAPPVNDSSVLADLLLKATDKRNQELDLGVLRRIKALCRKSEEHIRAVHDYLLHALEANHAQVCGDLWPTMYFSYIKTKTRGLHGVSSRPMNSHLCGTRAIQEDLSSTECLCTSGMFQRITSKYRTETSCCCLGVAAVVIHGMSPSNRHCGPLL